MIQYKGYPSNQYRIEHKGSIKIFVTEYKIIDLDNSQRIMTPVFEKQEEKFLVAVDSFEEAKNYIELHKQGIL